MELKQNPFSFYDFLGYFTPGALFVYATLAVAMHSDPSLLNLSVLKETTGFGKADLYIPFVLLSYTVGHILNFISSITVERYAIWALGYPSKYLLGISSEGYFGMKENRKPRIFFRCFVFVLLMPISLFDYLIGWFFGMRSLYAKQLDPLLVNLIINKIEPLLEEHGELKNLDDYGNAKDTNFFLYAYHYCVENSQHHLPKMQNYVALYGFLRTIALLSVIAFWVLVWHLFHYSSSLLSLLTILFFTSVMAYVLFVGFVKFYGRFSLEAMMALSVTYKTSNERNEK